MIQLLTSIIFILLFSSFISSQDRLTDRSITVIEYLNEINGYKINVYWKPEEINYNYVVGPAIFELYKTNDYSIPFILRNNYFALNKSRLPFTYNNDSTEIISTNEKIIQLNYHFPQNLFLNGEESDEPFLFEDINFDNNKELIISEYGNGQRYVSTYKVYGFEDGILNNEPYQFEPFKSLDGMSSINYANKSITIHSSGGWCCGTDEIYTLQLNEYVINTFVLQNIIEEHPSEDSNKCFELRYDVINGIKQLISITERK